VVFLGVDWGEHHHDLCVLDQDGSVLATRRIADGLAGVGELHTLVATHIVDPAQVTVGIETDRGLLVGASGGCPRHAVGVAAGRTPRRSRWPTARWSAPWWPCCAV
jgi:Transposase